MTKQKIIAPVLTSLMLAGLTSCSSLEPKYGYPMTFEEVVDPSKTNSEELLTEYSNSNFNPQGYFAEGTLYYMNENVGTVKIKIAENSESLTNSYMYFDFSIEDVAMKVETYQIAEDGYTYTNSSITVNTNGQDFSYSDKSKEVYGLKTPFSTTMSDLSNNFSSAALRNFTNIGVSSDNYLVCEENAGQTFARVVVDAEKGAPVFIAAQMEIQNYTFICNFDVSFDKQSAITAPRDAASYK